MRHYAGVHVSVRTKDTIEVIEVVGLPIVRQFGIGEPDPIRCDFLVFYYEIEGEYRQSVYCDLKVDQACERFVNSVAALTNNFKQAYLMPVQSNTGGIDLDRANQDFVKALEERNAPTNENKEALH